MCLDELRMRAMEDLNPVAPVAMVQSMPVHADAGPIRAVIFSYAHHGQAQWLIENSPAARELLTKFPEGYGYSLPWILLIWFAVVLILFPACRWLADYKQRHRYNRLSYL
jgi:hypothetical protein